MEVLIERKLHMSIITKNDGRLGDTANVDQGRDKITLPWSKSKMSNDRCFGVFFSEIRRRALLGVIFGFAVVLANGCSSTGEGLKAGLMAPIAEDRPFDPAEPGFSPTTVSRYSTDDLRALYSPKSSHTTQKDTSRLGSTPRKS